MQPRFPMRARFIRRRERRGIVLIISLIVAAVTAMSCLGVCQTLEVRIATDINTTDYERAAFAAEAGLQHAVVALQNRRYSSGNRWTDFARGSRMRYRFSTSRSRSSTTIVATGQYGTALVSRTMTVQSRRPTWRDDWWRYYGDWWRYYYGYGYGYGGYGGYGYRNPSNGNSGLRSFGNGNSVYLRYGF